MTKQEQIEEIYKILCKKGFDGEFSRAKFFYNAGYRKDNKEKNCWECIESKRVTAADYAKLQELFADYQLASEKEIRAHEERTKAFERNMKSVLEIEKENARKETAKEIISFIESKDKIGGKYRIYTKLLQELKEKYGEVE